MSEIDDYSAKRRQEPKDFIIETTVPLQGGYVLMPKASAVVAAEVADEFALKKNTDGTFQIIDPGHNSGDVMYRVGKSDAQDHIEDESVAIRRVR